MNKRQKKDLHRILVAAGLFVPLFVIEHNGLFDGLPYHWIALLICLVPYLIVGYDVIKKAVQNIKNGQIFDENFFKDFVLTTINCLKFVKVLLKITSKIK